MICRLGGRGMAQPSHGSSFRRFRPWDASGMPRPPAGLRRGGTRPPRICTNGFDPRVVTRRLHRAADRRQKCVAAAGPRPGANQQWYPTPLQRPTGRTGIPVCQFGAAESIKCTYPLFLLSQQSTRFAVGIVALHLPYVLTGRFSTPNAHRFDGFQIQLDQYLRTTLASEVTRDK